MDKVVYFSGAAGKLALGRAAESVQALLQIAHQFLDGGYLFGRGRNTATGRHDYLNKCERERC